MEDLMKGLMCLCLIYGLWCFGNMVVETKNAFANELNTETVQTVELKSIDYMSQVKGSFTLGFGRVNEIDYYGCYEVLEDGGIKLRKLRADTTIIYQTLKEGEPAYLEITTNGWGVETSIKLYVPENTIQVNYDFSLS